MDFRLSIEAENDLTKIWNYTFENWSIKQADRYVSLIFEEIEYVCKNPKSGNDFSHVRKRYFKAKVKSHLILYKVNIKEDKIEIIRILHQRMDVENRLK